MPDYATIIRDKRKEKSWSQEVLARKSGLSKRTIQRLEQGTFNPRQDTWKLICETLDIVTTEKNIEDINKNILAIFYISALGIFAFPAGNFIFPGSIYLIFKDNYPELKQFAPQKLKFQLYITLVLFLLVVMGAFLVLENHSSGKLLLWAYILVGGIVLFDALRNVWLLFAGSRTS